MALKGELGSLAPLATLSRTPKFQSLVTPIILIHWQFYYGKSCLEEKSSEKSGTAPSPNVYTRHLCLAGAAASDLRKEMSPARGDLYIRFARRCEPSDILHIRTVKFVLVFGAPKISYFPIKWRRRKYVRRRFLLFSPPPSAVPSLHPRENTHSVLSRRRTFRFSAISRLFLAVKHWRLFSQDSVSVEIPLPPEYGMRLLFGLALHEFQLQTVFAGDGSFVPDFRNLSLLPYLVRDELEMKT